MLEKIVSVTHIFLLSLETTPLSSLLLVQRRRGDILLIASREGKKEKK